MSILVFAWDDYTGGLVQYDNRLRVNTLEVTQMAEEFQSGAADVVLDDYTADFYVFPYRPMYFVETAAYGDAFFGIIGPFWTERRIVRRATEKVGSQRVWVVSLRDINSLLNLRVQKGTDAERDAETDVERVDWLINTAEVIGGFGDNGYTIEETEFFFTDGPVDMSESDYTFQYAEGVLRDCLDQGATKNGFLYPAPTSGSDPLRIGIWYGTTERSDFASLHKISNDPDDVSSEVISGFAGVTPQYSTGYVFPPSFDMELDRDPTRTITGAGLQWDGGNTYQSLPVITDTLTHRDMVFAGELVKNSTQATERLNNILEINQYEDDAIRCSVVVPDWLVHAFVAGQRVQFKATHLANLGYEDYVWMRVAKVTTRHISPSGTAPGVYELALDLRAESPPGPEAPAPVGPFVCVGGAHDATPSATYPRLGSRFGNSAMVHYYFRPGIEPPFEPTYPYSGSWHFPVFNGSGDFYCSNLNTWRILLVGPGTLTIHTVLDNTATYTAVVKKRTDLAEIGDSEVIATYPGTTGTDLTFDIPEDDAVDCIHYVDMTCSPPGGVHGIGANGCTWVLADA